MPRIYGSPSYAMGDEAVVKAAANAPVTSATAQKGKAELAKMRRSLRAWLKYRTLNNAVAAGTAFKPAALKRPGFKPMTKEQFAAYVARIKTQRAADEQELATKLYQLLSEVFDPSALPDPDLGQNPTAAVQLAKIAIAGTLPGEVAAPEAQGFSWMWPLVAVIGIIAITIMTQIKNSADVAKEKERLECIKAGACTDTGFFLKVGAAVVIGWFLWDKVGVGARVKGALAKK